MSNTYYLKIQAIQFNGSNQEEIANSLGVKFLEPNVISGIGDIDINDWVVIMLDEAWIFGDLDFKELCTKPITH